jgi:hypothetical protein
VLLPFGTESSVPSVTALVFSRLAPAEPTPVFETYWRFAAERQEIFFKRWRGEAPPWTRDWILERHKFTNAYRASDRASQFLVRHVIYSGSQDIREVFFRTILFKLFNRIETWHLLEKHLGPLLALEFNVDRYDAVLAAAMEADQRIYSGAYIMPSASRGQAKYKHRTHLELLHRMLGDELPQRLADSCSMQECFERLRAYPMMGDFLAYQYTIDLNYGPVLDFSEMNFVVPGPGARDGIRKCFRSLGGLTEADIIRLMADRQESEFERLGIPFKTLWGRQLQLIDCQNLFCEVDKYARYAHPEYVGITGRTKIKQMFRPNLTTIEYWYPPKWGLNDRITAGTEIDYAYV